MNEQPRIIRILDRGYTLIWREDELERALRGLDDEFEWEATDYRALAVVHMSGRSRGSGVPGEMHFGQIWEMRGGRFKRMTMYTDVEQARRAAGLTDE